MEDLKYPIGRFQMSQAPAAAERKTWIEMIEELPFELGNAVAGFNDAKLDAPYRDGGWSVRTVVHHVTDANIHFYCRSKYVVTEDRPTIIGFDEQDWIKTADMKLPADSALKLLEGLHVRWVAILKSLAQTDFERKYVHSVRGEEPLDYIVAYAAWHGRHHTAHITQLRKRMGW